MPDGFDAGSIFVQLKADLSDFNAGLALAKTGLDDLASGGQEVEVAFEELNTSVVVFEEMDQAVTQASNSFASLGAALAQSTTATTAQTQATDQNEQAHSKAGITWARSASRILSVQLALLQLSQNAAGPAKDTIQALANGVSVATAAFRLFQGSISLMGAGMIGVGVAAVSYFTRSLEDGIKATDATTASEIKARQSLTQLHDAFANLNAVSTAFAENGAQVANSKLQILEQTFSANLKQIQQIPDEIDAINQKLSAEEGKPFYEQSSVAIKQYKDQIQALTYTLENLKRTNADIAQQAPFAKANAGAQEIGQQLEKVNKQLQDTQDIGAKAVKLGVEDPATAATANLEEAKKKLDEILADELKLKELSATPGLSDSERAQIQSRLQSLDVSAAVNTYKAALQDKNTIDATNQLASTFSTSVGDGLRDAIINNQKSMQALATVGQNLFANMVDQTVKRLETGLTDAFKAITGVAGQGIGLALTGILGAAGAVLSKLGSSQSDSYGNVQSAVTSSQAVRGIVAGPASVAIADVGSNLQTAMQPVVDALTAANGWLTKIEKNTRGGGGGGSGSPQVAVATR